MASHAKRVLIVDDSMDDVFLLHRALRRSGVEHVHSITSGAEAAKFVSGLAPYQYEIPPEIIFTDLHMNQVDGLELVRWLKRDPLLKNIPVIVLSGSHDPKKSEEIIEAGATAIYQKPSKHKDLVTLVGTIVQERF